MSTTQTGKTLSGSEAQTCQPVSRTAKVETEIVWKLIFDRYQRLNESGNGALLPVGVRQIRATTEL